MNGKMTIEGKIAKLERIYWKEVDELWEKYYEDIEPLEKKRRERISELGFKFDEEVRALREKE